MPSGAPRQSEPPRADARVRARQLGLALGRLPPGPLNAITDVPGVQVGHCTLHSEPPSGAVRTGVTAILPASDSVYERRVVAGSFVLNGAGELTGLTQVREWGLIETPILLTGSLSVNAVGDALTRRMIDAHQELGISTDVVLPVVGECDDSWLNDARGCHVNPAHVQAALADCRTGPVAEGNVGAGTGMMTFDFAGGIGTASRVPYPERDYTLGALVLSNFGSREELLMGGLPMGQLLADYREQDTRREVFGSIVVVLATDAPLLPQQLDRLCKRAALGIARTGSHAAHGSGELVLAFSTQNRRPRVAEGNLLQLTCLHDTGLDPLFQAAVEVTEEAILNALCAAQSITGRAGHHAPALPLALVRGHTQGRTQASHAGLSSAQSGVDIPARRPKLR